MFGVNGAFDRFMKLKDLGIANRTTGCYAIPIRVFGFGIFDSATHYSVHNTATPYPHFTPTPQAFEENRKFAQNIKNEIAPDSSGSYARGDGSEPREVALILLMYTTGGIDTTTCVPIRIWVVTSSRYPAEDNETTRRSTTTTRPTRPQLCVHR